MTLLEFEELCDYWADHPPVHLMVAAYLGVGDKSESRNTTGSARRQSATPQSDTMLPMQLFGLPGLGATRSFSAEFGPDAIGEIQALWQRYEAAKAAG